MWLLFTSEDTNKGASISIRLENLVAFAAYYNQVTKHIGTTVYTNTYGHSALIVPVPYDKFEAFFLYALKLVNTDNQADYADYRTWAKYQNK